MLAATDVPQWTRQRFWTLVCGHPAGAPGWVRDIACVGAGPGWFEPDGLVWRVHTDLATLVGGITALLGQAAHPLALAGVQQHSSYQQDPWARLAGTARWLVTSTFGSLELAEREAARVRHRHAAVHGTDPAGRRYEAADPQLLRWVHLAFTDAFLAAHTALGQDLSGRFGPRWADNYLRQWQCSARALGASDLPTTRAELADALAAHRPLLEPVPPQLRAFLSAPPGLTAAEQLFYTGLARSAGLLLSPTLAPLAGVPGRSVPGRSRHSRRQRAQLHRTRLQLRALQLTLGPHNPAEQAARYRLGTGPRPDWIDAQRSGTTTKTSGGPVNATSHRAD